MDEDETVGWSNPSALAIEAHEDSIRQTLAERDAVIAEKEAEIAAARALALRDAETAVHNALIQLAMPGADTSPENAYSKAILAIRALQERRT